MEYVTVQDTAVPALGLGTWQLRGEECRSAVERALEIGYRHVDTAQMYRNEAAVGTAIANSDVDRDELFVVTKVQRKNLAHDDVIRSVEGSLDRLGTSIDLLLIHWPSRSVPIEETIGTMNRLQREAAVDHIGVSNFSVEQLREAIAASETPILTNQVEYHPLNRQDALLEFCLDNDVLLTAYSPLAKGGVVGNGTLREIGARYGKTEAQVALRWLLQQGAVAAIPKASSRKHQAENLDVFDFSLTESEMRRVFDVRGGLLGRLRDRLGI